MGQIGILEAPDKWQLLTPSTRILISLCVWEAGQNNDMLFFEPSVWFPETCIHCGIHISVWLKLEPTCPFHNNHKEIVIYLAPPSLRPGQEVLQMLHFVCFAQFMLPHLPKPPFPWTKCTALRSLQCNTHSNQHLSRITQYICYKDDDLKKVTVSDNSIVDCKLVKAHTFINIKCLKHYNLEKQEVNQSYIGQFQSLGPKRPGGPPGPRPPLLPASGGPHPCPCPPPPPFPAGSTVPHRSQTPLNAKLMLAQLHPQNAHMSTKNKRKSQSSLRCLVLHTEISWTPTTALKKPIQDVKWK